MEKAKIIVAEDDTVLRDLYLRKFDKSAYDVRTAGNGQETLDLVAKEAPDLLLLDINMPVMDGFQVLEKLPKNQRAFPVIILTNFDDQTNRARGTTLGVDDYFVKKDMTVKSLIEMVERLLQGKTKA
jgi:DNA-binding response OmpR family regulator